MTDIHPGSVVAFGVLHDSLTCLNPKDRAVDLCNRPQAPLMALRGLRWLGITSVPILGQAIDMDYSGPGYYERHLVQRGA